MAYDLRQKLSEALKLGQQKKKRLMIDNPNYPSGTYGTYYTPPVMPKPNPMRYREPSETYGEYTPPIIENPPATTPRLSPEVADAISSLTVPQAPTFPPVPEKTVPSIQVPPKPNLWNKIRQGATNIGQRLKGGLSELLTGMSMGREGYQQYNLNKAMLPYQEAEEAKNLASRKELLGEEYRLRGELEKQKPVKTQYSPLDEIKIRSLMSQIAKLEQPNMFDARTPQEINTEIDSLYRKIGDIETKYPSISQIAPVPQTETTGIINDIAELRKTKTDAEIAGLLREAGFNPADYGIKE